MNSPIVDEGAPSNSLDLLRRRGSKVVARLGAKLESNDRNYLRVSPQQQKASPGFPQPRCWLSEPKYARKPF
jgi:hypothetical protein